MDVNRIYAETLLRGALNWGQPDVPGRLRKALEAGADPNDLDALNPESRTALSQAIAKHDPGAVAVLLAFGASPSAPIRREVGAPTALQQARGEAGDGVKLGRPWAETALEVERLVNAAREAEAASRSPLRAAAGPVT